MRLSRDAAFLNRIVNDPSVFPYVSLGLPPPLDLSALVANERNYFFANEWGGFLVLDQGYGIFEIHSQFLPEGRGRQALAAGREAMAYMFTQTPCRALMTYCPAGNVGARALSRRVGMRSIGVKQFMNVPCEVYAISREEWLCLPQSR